MLLGYGDAEKVAQAAVRLQPEIEKHADIVLSDFGEVQRPLDD